MLGLLPLALLASLCKSSRDVYYNKFGVGCDGKQENCAQDRCILLGSDQLCTQCVPGYVPIDGKCQKYPGASSSPCTPDDPASPTRCIACKQETNIFLFYGSCYTITTAQDRNLGNFLCSEASNGVCTECFESKFERYVFTNPDVGAVEKCILCSDTVGFNGYKGASGCSDCLPPITDKIGIALCVRCHYTTEDRHFYPIDYQCQAKGPHNCVNGYCTSCYKTHLLYKLGCYSRHSSTGLAICVEANQYELDNVTICKECANASYAPRNGACILIKENPSIEEIAFKCTKDPTKGLYTACPASAKSFLFYGGCYDEDAHISSRLCSRIGSNACEQWNSAFKWIFSKNGDNNKNGYLCGDITNGGISGCATCNYASGAVTCTRCSAGYLGVDGKSCSESCSGDTQGACTEIVEKSSSTKILSCRCICRMGLYNSSGTCTPCTDSCAVCKDGTLTGCQQCSPGKILSFSIASSESADCVSQCSVGSECAECGITIDGSRYCTRCKDASTYPFNGVCILNTQRDAYCTSKANGVCTTCSSSAFLMNGGCYTKAHYPGSTICDKQSNGKCTTTKKGYGISPDGKLLECDPTCLACTAPGPGRCTRCPSDKLLKRASGATTGSCVDPGACVDGYYADGDACLPCATPGCKACGHASFCTECAGELFVSLDGQSCLEECTGDKVVGEVPGGVRRCWCERGFLPALDRSECVLPIECPPDMPSCAACNESGNCLSCVTSGHNVQVDQRTCAEGCGARASSNQGVCMCEFDAVLTKDICVSAKELAKKRTAAIAGGTVAGVIVIGSLVGFLCW
ncbi:High cysteine membrane protein Group 4 [Giardia duodenalis]|uniref:High cysteine membrane protein Group 4 n=1 Tax=Giardia intestinalis (strain ATCC 50803 / WB clone C6) TaxID=184922 RepID=A8BWB7_GIAIC|nr:High cysteine membrane protein Group 4 [Giardia intestinalis]KAE8306022.1 High cysteine membrane protein Group 4 [Giardia intestinalis]|eukprot:XP_001704473.1 High cysteine membrane protein Group 4 [Giardia lamblia ATCC 50803]